MDLFEGTGARKQFNNCLSCSGPILPCEVHICKRRVAARNTDPATSHQAAHEVERSGLAKTQRDACLREVRTLPGQTAGEIGKKLGILAHKRLPELRDVIPQLIKNGEARMCTVNGTRQMTWWPVETNA